jgi:tRNA pseudouridine38-40 synthase
MRYKITVEYDGTRFCGWQYQEGVLTVQRALQESCVKLTQENVLVTGAGRTDTGVHALGQVAHFDLKKPWDPYLLRKGLNFYLQSTGVSIISITEVDPSFHARFSAKGRSYCYKILNRASDSPLNHQRCWFVPQFLDEKLMREGARYLMGHHNFNAFRSSRCQSDNPTKTLNQCDVQRYEDYIYIKVSAPSFLHNQVRIIVGSLKKVGDKTYPPEWIHNLLISQDRKKAGPTAPPYGLYFESVVY